jgi:hypothetical protein
MDAARNHRIAVSEPYRSGIQYGFDKPQAGAAGQNLLRSSIPVGYHAPIMKSWKLIVLLLVLAAGLAIGAGVSMLHNGLSAHATPTAMEALLARNARHLAIPANARDERNPVTPSDQILQVAMGR